MVKFREWLREAELNESADILQCEYLELIKKD